MKHLIRLLVATAAGLEAATDTYRAVTQQQLAVDQLIVAEQEAITEAQARRQPLGFTARTKENRS